MYTLPIFDVDGLPKEVNEALEACVDSIIGIPDILGNQDYLEWPLEISAGLKRAISEETWENYRIVNDFILDEIEMMDIGDNTYVLVRTY